MLIASLVVIGVAGWGMARARPKIELVMLVFAMFGAVSVHSAIQYAFVDARMDSVFGDPRTGGMAALLIPIAIAETTGLWLPFILIGWAQMSVRLWMAVYVIGTAMLAAVYYDVPFDPIIRSKSLISGFGPPYLLTVLIGIPLAAIGYAFGAMSAMNNQKDPDDDYEMPVAP